MENSEIGEKSRLMYLIEDIHNVYERCRGCGCKGPLNQVMDKLKEAEFWACSCLDFYDKKE